MGTLFTLIFFMEIANSDKRSTRAQFSAQFFRKLNFFQQIGWGAESCYAVLPTLKRQDLCFRFRRGQAKVRL